jgi:hypothetical protein
MISDRCPDANRKVLIKSVGEHLLPTAQAGGLWRRSPPVAAPSAGNRHIDLFRYLWPGEALITKFKDLLSGGGVSVRTAATHCDAGPLELLADRAPMNAQLSSDLAQGPAPGVQVGCTLNVHRDTVASLRVGRATRGSAVVGTPSFELWTASPLSAVLNGVKGTGPAWQQLRSSDLGHFSIAGQAE